MSNLILSVIGVLAICAVGTVIACLLCAANDLTDRKE